MTALLQTSIDHKPSPLPPPQYADFDYYSSPRSSNQRQPFSPFRLNDLPAELRLRILELSLPSVTDVSRPWAAPIPSLLATSRRVNSETREAMKNWSPIHYVPDPDSLHLIPMPGVCRVDSVCLSMFHDARIGVLRSGPLTRSLADDHKDLIIAWTEHIVNLPMHFSIENVIIDATPAPGWMRYEKPGWVNNIINDKTVSARFIYEHITVIADLMSAITERYQSLGRDINLELTGLYGQESYKFPVFIKTLCEGRGESNMTFTGDIVEDDHCNKRPPMTVEHGIAEIYPPTGNNIGGSGHRKRRQSTSTSRRHLLQYDFTPTSDFLFANCFEDSAYWTMHQLKRMTSLVLDDKRRTNYVDISIADFAQGSLICSLAKDMRLSTSPRSTWRRQKIRVYRRDQKVKRKENEEETKQTSPLLSAILVSTTIVLLFGILSNNSKRRRAH